MKTSRIQAEQTIKLCMKTETGNKETILPLIQDLHMVNTPRYLGWWLFTIDPKKADGIYFNEVEVVYYNPSGILCKLKEETIINKLNLK